MEDTKLQEQIYRLHCHGHEVSKIAKQLSLSTDTVRGYITAQWYDDKVEAQMTRKPGSGKRR